MLNLKPYLGVIHNFQPLCKSTKSTFGGINCMHMLGIYTKLSLKNLLFTVLILILAVSNLQPILILKLIYTANKFFMQGKVFVYTVVAEPTENRGGYLNFQDKCMEKIKITFLWSDSKIRGAKAPLAPLFCRLWL